MHGISMFIIQSKAEAAAGSSGVGTKGLSTNAETEHLTPNSASAGRGTKLMMPYIKNIAAYPSMGLMWISNALSIR